MTEEEARRKAEYREMNNTGLIAVGIGVVGAGLILFAHFILGV